MGNFLNLGGILVELFFAAAKFYVTVQLGLQNRYKDIPTRVKADSA
jgi:hypothetical protein